MILSSASRTATGIELLGLFALGWLLIAGRAEAQTACSNDLDCAEDLVCMRVLFGVDCNDAGCIEVQEQGFCSEPAPTPLFCDDEAQCPSPLFCDADNPGGALCAYVEPMCSTDDDECPDGFMCVDLEPLGGCSICNDDGEIVCTPAPCADNNLNVCSPIPMSCERDADCADGFVCGEIGPFDLQTGWDESLVGTEGCLSVGLIALTDGIVQGGQDAVPDGGVPSPEAGAGGSAGTSAGMSGGAGTRGDAAGEGGSAGDSGTAGTSGGADAEPAGGSSDGGCNCSVRTAPTSRVIALAMLIALLIGARLVRRWPVG